MTVEDRKLVAIDNGLAINGITKPVRLTETSFFAKPHSTVRKDAIGVNITVPDLRPEFSAGKHAPYVGDNVRMDIAVETIKEYIQP